MVGHPTLQDFMGGFYFLISSPIILFSICFFPMVQIQISVLNAIIAMDSGNLKEIHAALEAAARSADVETVRLLLDSGAKIENGYPLLSAAGVCPSETNPHAALVTTSREFDIARIPVMELLVSHGVDLNEKEESRYMVPGYPIVYAVMVGAVERVNWLLEHGANLELKGSYGSAVNYGELMRSEEMKRAIRAGVNARKWLEDHDPRETNSVA